jgi:2-amino-4-hydroxy-6-hydroxymethyldihydropteridine diphosphokinase
LREALGLLAEMGAEVERVSSFYRTEPVEAPGPWFLNAVARLQIPWPPHELLARCEEIERLLGRERKTDRAPRTIDLDLLVYGDITLDTPDLVLPHPRLARRRFVLIPLDEIAPDLEVPGLGATVRELLKACPDRGGVDRTVGTE